MARVAVPAGRDVRRDGHQLRAVLRGRGPGRALPVRRRRPGDRDRAARGGRRSSGTATCPTSARASGTATACTARTTRRAGSGATRTSCCSTRTRRPSTARSTGTRRCSATSFERPGPAQRRRLGAVPAQGGRRQPVLRLGHRPPAAHRPYNETVIYEAHVKGLTFRNPDIPRGDARHVRGARPPGDDRPPTRARRHRGRADAGAPVRPRPLAAPSAGCATTGATTRSASSPRTRLLVARARRGQQVQEFKAMVRALHEAGIEVILDVVYNHTAEGNHLGPTLSLRGHRQRRRTTGSSTDSRQYYMDYTGTGNTLNVRHPHTLQLIMDSLRYWVHRDARRRLPLRPGRDAGPRVLRRRPAVDVLRPGPAGPGGLPGQAHRRAVGRRPRRLPGRQLPAAVDRVERQVPRHGPRLLARRAGDAGEFAARITGSPDLYQHDGRRPFASINFVTAHDGFTLRDLVSYNEKHNEANGEDNRDGETHNRSWNCGVEGETDDLEILALRAQQRRNFLATLFLSQGVPMLLHGDETRPHPAGQQQRLLPGQRPHLAGLGARRRASCCEFTRAAVRSCAASTRCSAGAGSSPAGRCGAAAASRCRTSPGSPRTAREMTEDDWEAGFGRVGRGLPQRRGHPATASRAASGSSTTRSS